MSNVSFCIEQRQKELQQTQKMLALGLLGSVAVHAAIALAVVGLYEKPTIAEDPIELIMIEESEPVPEVPKSPTPKEAAKPQPMKVNPPKPQPLSQTQVSNPGSGGGKQQASTKIPEPQGIEQPSTVRPNTQPTDPITPTQPKTSPIATSSPLPSAKSENPQSVLSDPYQSNDSTVAANSDPSAEPSGSGFSPSAVSGNSEGIQGFGAGLAGTSTGGGSGGGSGGGIGSGSGSGNGDGSNPGSGSGPALARTGIPDRPKPRGKGEKEGVRCISECEPPYPSVLNGVEGSAGVQLMIDASGNVLSVTLSKPNSNSQINQQALLSARKMKFSSPPNGDRASVQVTVNFTVAGSEFDRRARELREQQQRQRQATEQKRREQQAQLEQERLERQRQLEAERQQRERQAQLEKERQEQQRQQQLQQQQQQQQPKPETEIKPEPMSEPAQLSPTPQLSPIPQLSPTPTEQQP